MGSITTAGLNSFKSDLLSAIHCFEADVTPTGDTDGSTPVITNLSALTGCVVGRAVSGTGVAAGSVIASIDGAAQITLSKDTTGAGSGTTLTISGDVFKIALIKDSPTGDYDADTTNYTDVTGNSDETSGTGYSAGGGTLTNVSPVLSTVTAYVDFDDFSWTTATFSTSGCLIYNTTRRGPTATPGCSVHSFGGTQTVTVGTFTAVFPTADASNAIIRIGNPA